MNLKLNQRSAIQVKIWTFSVIDCKNNFTLYVKLALLLWYQLNNWNGVSLIGGIRELFLNSACHCRCAITVTVRIRTATDRSCCARTVTLKFTTNRRILDTYDSISFQRKVWTNIQFFLKLGFLSPKWKYTKPILY